MPERIPHQQYFCRRLYVVWSGGEPFRYAPSADALRARYAEARHCRFLRTRCVRRRRIAERFTVRNTQSPNQSRPFAVLYVVNEDFRLAQRATRGDTDAMGRLVERHRASLFRIAYRDLSSYEDAQDAVAESVVRACRFVHRLKHPEQFVPWIRAIVRNESRRSLARRRRQEAQEAHLIVGSESLPRPDELSANVRRAIYDLPNDQAYAVQQYYLNGASVKEISQSLARPEGTVKWMLSRGRARLAETLKEYRPMNDTQTRRAVLITPNFDSSYQKELAGALTHVGWNTVRTVSDSAEFLQFLTPNKQDMIAPSTLITAGDFVVLSERIGNVTAWELMPFLLSARKKTDFTILLIVEEGRTAEEMNLTAMSGYLSGMDFLLVRPIAPGGFIDVATRALQPPT